MSASLSQLAESLASIAPVALISVVGGVLDYLYALSVGKRVWSFAGFVLHLALSLFAGYLSALALIGLGYSAEVAGAGAGAAGFLNIRVIDLIALHLKKRGDRNA